MQELINALILHVNCNELTALNKKQLILHNFGFFNV